VAARRAVSCHHALRNGVYLSKRGRRGATTLARGGAADGELRRRRGWAAWRSGVNGASGEWRGAERKKKKPGGEEKRKKHKQKPKREACIGVLGAAPIAKLKRRENLADTEAHLELCLRAQQNWLKILHRKRGSITEAEGRIILCCKRKRHTSAPAAKRGAYPAWRRSAREHLWRAARVAAAARAWRRGGVNIIMMRKWKQAKINNRRQ